MVVATEQRTVGGSRIAAAGFDACGPAHQRPDHRPKIYTAADVKQSDPDQPDCDQPIGWYTAGISKRIVQGGTASGEIDAVHRAQTASIDARKPGNANITTKLL